MDSEAVKLISWNVNGLRAVLKRGDLDPIVAEAPDVICLVETKASPQDIEQVLPDYPYQYWSAAERKGYSGVAVFSRLEPQSSSEGIGNRSFDAEGRLVTVRFGDFAVVAVYTPNAGRGLSRLDYRQEWDEAFRTYVRGLDRGTPVVFCGDLNVAHEEIDLARPRANRRNAGFTDEEREGFSRTLEAGFLDTFRLFEKGEGHYTWWSYMHNARAKNIGWRIDYVCVSERIKDRVTEAFILKDIMGSDHCPVGVVIE